MSIKHPTQPAALFDSFWRHRHLIWQMAKRDAFGRYRGSMLGVLWSFVQPLLMLFVYTFVFGFVFRARTGVSPGGGRLEFALFLFSGLIVFWLFSECVTRAPTLILTNVNYVKKVVFPLEVLPWVGILSTLFHLGMRLAVLLLFYVGVHLSLHWTTVLIPLVFLPLIFLCVGISWFLASLGVYVRDIGQTVGVIVTVAMYLSAIFYPVSALPESVRGYFMLNPLAFLADQSRAVVIWGRLPNWGGLALCFLFSLAVAWLGFYWFQRTRKGFADVL